MLNIMTVEDNLSYREALKNNLLSQLPSTKIIEAANGDEAFRRLSSNPTDFVFMDISLPGENGLELTRKIKAQYKDVAIAMVTSHDSAEYREAAARCGANCFITKASINFDQISAMVKCFQRAKDSIGLKPSCVRLASEG